MKYCAAPVLPTLTLDKSAQRLSQKAIISTKTRSIIVAKQLNNEKLWSNLPTSKFLTTLGEGLVIEQLSQRDEYESVRIAHDVFQVRRLLHGQARGPVPVFRWVGTVLIRLGRLHCDCCYFERIGIVCRHMMHVLTKISPQYPGCSHNDNSVFWWTKYAFYG